MVIFLLLGFLYFKTQLFKSSPSDGKIKAEAIKINNECKKLTTIKSCYNEKFYKLSKNTDLDYSIEVLNTLQKINPQASTGCHLIAHRITQAETEKNPESWKEILQKVSPATCTGGFLHGVLEVHAQNDPKFTINNSTVDSICKDLLSGTFTGERSCYHNMGHLMLIQTDADLNISIDNCQKLTGSLPSYECLSGAFMENLTAENLVAHGYLKERIPWTEERATEIEALCNTYEGQAAKACWKELSYIYTSIYKQDPKKLLDACNKAPEKTSRDECYVYGVGNIVNMPRVMNGNIINLCSGVKDDKSVFDYCMRQVVWTLVTSNTNNIDRAIKLCAAAPEKYKAECFYNIVDYLQMNKVDKSIINSTCDKITPSKRPDSCVA